MDGQHDRTLTEGVRASGVFFVLATVVLVVVCLWLTRDYVVPIAVAVLIWFLISAMASALRRHLPALRRVPLMAAKLAAAAILFALIALAVQMLSDGLSELARHAAGQREAVYDALAARLAGFGVDLGTLDFAALAERLGVADLVGSVIGAARSLLSDTALVFLYVMFLLIDERFFDAKLRAMIRDRRREAQLRETLESLAATTRVYLWLMSLVSAGVAVATFAICAAFGVEGAGVWGVLAFALNFVPTIGSIAAVALPAAYALVTIGDVPTLAALIAALAAVHFVAGEIVVPRVMGDRLNLSSFVILLCLIVWGAIWGPVGMFLAIPITVILVLIAARFEATRPFAILLSKDGRVPVPGLADPEAPGQP